MNLRFFLAVHPQRELVGVGILEAGKKHVEINLVPAKMLGGTVVDSDGRPLAGAQVALLPMTSFYVLTDSKGGFDIGWSPTWARDLKEFLLMARHGGRNLAAAIEFDEDTETVHVTLEPALTLTGTVEDPNGIPIAGAKVGVSLRKGWACGTPVRPVLSDDRGHYEFKALPQKQEWIVYASANGFVERAITTGIINKVTDREDVRPITLKKPNLSVYGVVVDEAGKPVANCRVGVRGEGQPDRMTETNAEGKFTIEKICSGRIEIWAKLDSVLYGTVEARAGQKDVKLVVAPIE